jgi:hypothetical protein
MAGHGAMLERIRTSFKHTFRVLHTFALEVIGGFFLALAAYGGLDALRRYREYVAGGQGGLGIVLDALFILSMLAFGLHSFWKSRKIQK